MRNRIEDSDLRLVSETLQLPFSEVKRAVGSFFSVIASYMKHLPFDNDRKIYTKEAFGNYERVWNIPYIGRIGLSYSRYLKWRANEAKNNGQVNRSSYRGVMIQDEIEHMADVILSGGTPSPVPKRKRSELFKRVWLVGKDGKRSARQVIPN